MSQQHPLTLVTPVKPNQHDNLKVLLQKIKTDLDENKHEQFENLGTIHYARWVLIGEADTDEVVGPDIGARLVFSSNFDGNEDEHLSGLSNSVGSFIDQIYEYCEGYPEPNARTPESRKAYLKKWSVKPSSFYEGAPGRDVKQIKNENDLRNFIREFLNTKDWKDYSAVKLHKAIQQAVFAKPEFEWAKKRDDNIPGMNWLGLAWLGLIIIVLLPVIIIWVLIIHFVYERNDKNFDLLPSQVDEAHLRELEKYEDHENQNQFTQVVLMKPGKVRLISYKALMRFSKALIRYKFVKGKLMGIPTIHFARWVLIDNDQRVLFFSNFDGSWQQYLGDFIDKSGWGLTGIFSNTRNFPKTKFLFSGGAYDEEHFLAWSRSTEIPTQVWYCAYPHLSIKNIVNNTEIRQALPQDLNESQARKFLQRF